VVDFEDANELSPNYQTNPRLIIVSSQYAAARVETTSSSALSQISDNERLPLIINQIIRIIPIAIFTPSHSQSLSPSLASSTANFRSLVLAFIPTLTPTLTLTDSQSHPSLQRPPSTCPASASGVLWSHDHNLSASPDHRSVTAACYQ
jgi:hypothetical protein